MTVRQYLDLPVTQLFLFSTLYTSDLESDNLHALQTEQFSYTTVSTAAGAEVRLAQVY